MLWMGGGSGGPDAPAAACGRGVSDPRCLYLIVQVHPCEKGRERPRRIEARKEKADSAWGGIGLLKPKGEDTLRV